MEDTRARGTSSLALTVNAESAVAQAADHCLPVEVSRTRALAGNPRLPSEPYRLALAGARARPTPWRAERIGSVEVDRGTDELAETIEITGKASGERFGALSQNLLAARALMVLGSGPSYGTARFAAAKLVESAGVLGLDSQLHRVVRISAWA